MWIATTELPMSPGHPFYVRLNEILDAAGFDRFVEEQCRPFYAPVMGRPSLAPGRYFRLLLIGYFEGLDSERGIAWRAADSLAVRQFLGLGLNEAAPDHSTISRTRRLIDVEAHQAVFTWVQERLVEAHLLRGRTLAVDATTLEANAAMRSIVRRDTGESYQQFLTRLAKASGLKTPRREALARLDRRRKKRTSNAEWVNPSDPDAKVTQLKDGRTHLAHKVEHAVDLETGALVAVTLHGADVGDTTSVLATTLTAAEQLAAVQATAPTALVGDRGYHSNDTLLTLQALGIRAYLVEPDRGRRCWARGARSPRPGLRQSPADRRAARPAVDAAPRRVCRADVCSCLRHRRAAPGPLARSSEHLEAIDRARRRLQSRAPDASRDRPRDAPRPSGPPAAIFRTLADPILALRRAPSDSDEPQRALSDLKFAADSHFALRRNVLTVMPFTTGC